MAKNPRLVGKICLVTGATRGIGRGIALQLGVSGATVYITGRTLKKGSGDVGSLEDTARDIEEHGGRCIPVQCDHSKDDDIQKLFERIKMEQNGQLDVLVNNAYSAVNALSRNTGIPFWEQPISMWDEVNVVGLRNHYICAVHAARMMVPRKSGLIVNISSVGGLSYLFNVAYGVGKEACDRMAADCGKELKRSNVAFLSLWPAAVQTELMVENTKTMKISGNMKNLFTVEGGAETTEFAGKAVAFLAADPNIMQKSGRIILTADVASEFGFVDVNGKTPMHLRSLSTILKMQGFSIYKFIPGWIKLPGWIFSLGGNKF